MWFSNISTILSLNSKFQSKAVLNSDKILNFITHDFNVLAKKYVSKDKKIQSKSIFITICAFLI